MNQSEVSRHLKRLGLDAKTDDMDTIRLAYIQHLREVAAAHISSDGDDLTKVRIQNETADLELKRITIAERRGQVVNLEQLKPDLANAFYHIKTSLLTAADKLKPVIDARYGIDFDVNLINAEHDHALVELSRYAGKQ